MVDLAATVYNARTATATAPTCTFPQAPPRSLAKVLASAFLERACHSFLEAFVASMSMSLAFHITYTIYWEYGTQRAVHTMWGSVKDFFGDCGMSGFGDAWGYSCLPNIGNIPPVHN